MWSQAPFIETFLIKQKENWLGFISEVSKIMDLMALDIGEHENNKTKFIKVDMVER